jgi:4-amino-4-deoxy-L-arabinose transferase-like glycosyltransferase
VTGGLPLRRLRRVGPVVALVALGLGLFLPGLGHFGLWEPWERTLADQAAALDGVTAGTGAGAARPGLPLFLPAVGMRLLGISEGAARLPGALLAVATLLAVAWAGSSLFGRRAGLTAALVLAGIPLFVLQGRQLTSDMALLFASTLVLGGLGRLAARRARASGRSPSWRARPGWRSPRWPGVCWWAWPSRRWPSARPGCSAARARPRGRCDGWRRWWQLPGWRWP